MNPSTPSEFLRLRVSLWGPVSAAGWLATAATLWPCFFPRAAPPSGTAPPLRVMLLNVNTHAGDPPRVARAISEFAPDVLNVSPWSVHFRRLVRDTALRDSARGRGLHPTWPAGLPWLWIPLDHALHSDDIQVVTRTVGPNVGSDHYPLILDLRLPSPSKP